MEEPQEEVSMRSRDNKEQTNIVKGKRNKRQRPQSRIAFVKNSSDYGDHKNVTSLLSPAVSAAEEYFDSTEEDEDMANCLILLAQCQSRESPKQMVDQEEMGQIHSKFNSRRFLEAPSSGTGTGKAGYNVYECKTCNRTFSSFQALGGHRASHKKPKAMNEERLINNESQQFLVSSDEEEGNFRNVSSSLSVQLSNNNNNRGMNNNNNFYSNSSKSNKVHVCSICGTEFTSGQALGGHMRRHREPVRMKTTLSLTPMAVESHDQEKKKQRNKNNNVLPLDLYLILPAPEDDQSEKSQIPFSSSKQQQQQQQKPQQQQRQQKSTLVFSATPTLVDCH